jgi:hypothetical protein
MVFGTTEVMFERVGLLLYANEHSQDKQNEA